MGLRDLLYSARARGARIAGSVRSKLDRYGPMLVPVVLAAVGAVLIAAGSR